MKLVFPNGEHAQVELAAGAALVGAAADCEIVLDHASVADQHARIQLKEGVATIKVFNVTDITRINGELVAATRMLNSGDALLFGEVQCVVVGEAATGATGPAEPEEPEAAMTRMREAPPAFSLRGISGSSFGKTYPILRQASIGRAPDADIRLESEEISRRHAEIRVGSDGLHLEDLGSSNGTYVNGKRVRRSKLEPGDEIKFDTERFLVQAPPGLASSPVASAVEEATEVRSSARWLWLLLAAVVAVAAWRLLV